MQQQPPSRVSPTEPELSRLLDMAVGVSGRGVATATALGRRVGTAGRSAGRPVVHLVLRPPVVPRRGQPATWWDELSRQGDRRRAEVARRVSALLDVVVPALVAQVLRRVDAADLVHTYVDVDEIIAEVDLDAVVSRIDMVTLVK